ncbi:MAG: VanZ family protein [Candidatus Eisenbacteria bacterium]|nr:VanZ family protein [Candidatus Eisenbacteria bacterium]
MRELEGSDVRFLSIFLRFWLPVLGYIALIFGVSSISDLPGPTHIRYLDKFAHFAEYGLLGFLVGRTFRHSGPGFLRRFWFGFAIIAAVTVGFCDEWYQSTVPGRSRSVFDFLADVAGATFGQFALFGVESKWRRKKNEENSSR